MLKRSLLPRVTVSLLALGAMPLASASDDAGWYLTGSVGSAQYRMDIASQIRNACAGLCSVESATLDGTNATSYRFGGGYQVNRYLAAEVAFVDLGDVGSHYRMVSTGVTSDIRGKYRLDGYQVLAVGRWPVTESIAVLGKLGIFASRLRYSEAGTVQFQQGPYSFVAPHDNATKATFGLGAEYRLDPRWAIRVDWDRYQGIGHGFALTESDNGRFDSVDSYSVGISYRF
jgi:opacity protein-like surface antigen